MLPHCSADDSDGGTGDEDEGGDNPLSTLEEKLDELTNAHDLMEKNCHQINKFLSDLEDGMGRNAAVKAKEKLTLFKLTSAALVKVSEGYKDIQCKC